MVCSEQPFFLHYVSLCGDFVKNPDLHQPNTFIGGGNTARLLTFAILKGNIRIGLIERMLFYVQAPNDPRNY